jgi:hypothetical protein
MKNRIRLIHHGVNDSPWRKRFILEGAEEGAEETTHVAGSPSFDDESDKMYDDSAAMV